MKPVTLFGSSIIAMMILIVAAAFINKNNDLPQKHVEVVLRNVAHELLLTAKDSTSRVLPVKKLDENTYQLYFQDQVSFVSDTIMDVIQRTFKKNGLPPDYIVSLKNCNLLQTVFAFEINSQTGDLKGCGGRKLDTGCYLIEIEFLKNDQYSFLWLLLLIIPLGLAGFYLKQKFRKKQELESIPENDQFTQLGNFKFYPADNMLKMGDNSITLSEKETKALKIFAENINHTVEREKLMKEIWEDEGIVVISRNVDVLVSKLRKKLSDDKSIQFVNVPGRGYKFVIG